VGERNNRSKLTESQVREIRTRFATNGNRWPRGQLKALTAEFGITSTQVDYITRHKGWSHI
jgi:hypothetical protein